VKAEAENPAAWINFAYAVQCDENIDAGLTAILVTTGMRSNVG
jgi:hypothetical protein